MPTRPDARLRLLLACLLLGAYLFVYTRHIDAIDGQALLAAASAFVKHGVPEIGAIGAQDTLLPFDRSRMIAYGEDGAPYSKKGVTPSLLLLPFVIAADVLPGLDTRAAAMLSTPLVTTAAALALYTLARWLGYRPRTAFAAGLIYGLATTALPYVRTLYGEPLAALLLLLALMGAYRWRAAGGLRWLLLSGAATGLLVGVNLVGVVFIPALALSCLTRLNAFTRDQNGHGPISVLRPLLTWTLPLALILGAIALYNWARFGSPLASGYHFASGEGFTRPLLDGVYGLWLGPYRGLLWYSPVVLLALPGAWMLGRAHGRLTWTLLTLIGLQTLSYASWWSWDGGIAWGPRFLVVILPLLIVLLVPLIEAAWSRKGLLAAVVGFAGLSFGVQLLGTLYSIDPWMYWLFTRHSDPQTGFLPQVYSEPALSAISGHLALALAGAPIQVEWLQAGNWAQPLTGAALVLVGAWIAWRRPRCARRLAVLASAAALLTAAISTHDGDDPIAALQAALDPPETVIVASAGFDDALLDLDVRAPVISTNAPTAPDDRLTRPLWRYGLAQGGRVWLVTWFQPGDPANWQACELWRRAAFRLERSAAGHRLLLFDLRPAPEPDRTLGYRFGSLVLARIGSARTDNGLSVTLAWQADSALSADYGWFVHVIDADGQIIAQQDRPPQGGCAPTSGWAVGETILDRLVFDGDFPPDSALRIGWIDPATGARLPTFDVDGAPLADGFAIVGL